MKNTLKIVVFTVLVTAFYSYVGQMVPQKEAYPPEETELNADMTTEEMVAAGKQIVEGKGTCLGCHTIGSEGGALRFPDLAGVGARAGHRREGMTDIEYLAQSLYEPSSYIVEGFQPGMPEISKPPIDLSDAEIHAVIAYLQSLGGTPSITMDTDLGYETDDDESASVSTAAAAPAGADLDGPTLFSQYLCNTCHNIDKPGRLVGPSLYDVGSRLSHAEIYEAIVEPNATVVEGYPEGVMAATLGATGFPDKVTSKQLKTLVEFLSSHKGE